MATADENKATRTEQSREVAKDAAEAYRAAVSDLMEAMDKNREQTALLEVIPLPRSDYLEQRRDLRVTAWRLSRQGRQLGIHVTKMAERLGVSRQTIHEWINEGES